MTLSSPLTPANSMSVGHERRDTHNLASMASSTYRYRPSSEGQLFPCETCENFFILSHDSPQRRETNRNEDSRTGVLCGDSLHRDAMDLFCLLAFLGKLHVF